MVHASKAESRFSTYLYFSLVNFYFQTWKLLCLRLIWEGTFQCIWCVWGWAGGVGHSSGMVPFCFNIGSSPWICECQDWYFQSPACIKLRLIYPVSHDGTCPHHHPIIWQETHSNSRFQNMITPKTREKKYIWNIFSKINVYNQPCDGWFCANKSGKIIFPVLLRIWFSYSLSVLWHLPPTEDDSFLHLFTHLFSKCLLIVYLVPNSARLGE